MITCKKRPLRYTYFFTLLVLATLHNYANSQESTHCNEMNLIAFKDHPPLYWAMGTEIKGAAITIAELFAKKAQIKLNIIKERSYRRLLESIKSTNKVYFLPSSSLVSQDLINKISPKYYTSAIGVFSIKSKEITYKQLSHDNFYRIIAVNLQKTEVQFKDIPTKKLNHKYGDIKKYLEQLNAGNLRHIIADKTYFGVISNTEKLKNIMVSSFSVGEAQIHYGISKDSSCSQLQQSFAQHIKAMIEKNEINSIIDDAYADYFL